MIVKFGKWAPDAAYFGVVGQDAPAPKNVIPTENGYQAIPRGTNYGNDTVSNDTDVWGGFSATAGTKTVDTIGTPTRLYTVDSEGTTINDASGTTYALSTADSEFWDFAQFGNYAIAVNGNRAASDVPQVKDISGTTAAVYADLGGSPPRAATVTAVRDFVVMGRTYDATDGQRFNRVWWSGFGDHTYWTPDAARQCDFQDLETEVGGVERVLGGEDAFVVCNRAVVLMRYEGPPTIFRFDVIHPGIGTIFPRACARDGNYLYMWSNQGFVRLGRQSGDVLPIGKGIIDRTFQNLVNSSSSKAGLWASFDRLNNMVWWGNYNGGGTIYGYSVKYNEWITRDDVARYFAWDSDVISVSGRKRQGLVWIDTDNRLYGNTSNTEYEAFVLSTPMLQLSEGRRTLVTRARPLIEASTAPPTLTLDIYKYDDAASTPDSINVAQSNLALNTTNGHFDTLAEGRHLLFVLEGAAGVSTGEINVLGLDIEAAASGGRF